jgi:hypothetical protein
MSQELLLERIAELLEREHDAIATIDLGTLASIQSERSELLSELREAIPSERAALASLERTRSRNERAAEAALGRIGGALGRLGRGRTALVGYRPNAGGTVLPRVLDKEV